MKRKMFFILLLFYPGFILLAQEPVLNKTMYDSTAKQQILIGYCNRAGLESGIFGQYFRDEYDHYNPDPDLVDEIRGQVQGTGITIVMGTWCSDSREQIGRFYKILDLVKFPTDKITLICVDKKKKGGDVSLEGMDIQKVPTFIFYHKGKETGRIIETPVESLEKDLLGIIQE